MNILEKIIAQKRIEVEILKSTTNVDDFISQPLFLKKKYSLRNQLLNNDAPSIIAEFKRKSPSKGIINSNAQPAEIAKGYVKAGAKAISVLTDGDFFGGSLRDFKKVRNVVQIPLLRKEFIIDDIQVYQTKAAGADLMLLIAANLEKNQCQQLAKTAKSIGLEVLLEIHTEEELDYIGDNIDIVGINNRNLKTFKVDLNNSAALAEKIGDDYPKIAESGISNPDNIFWLQEHGFSGFLIGETFMKTAHPAQTCATFIQQLKTKR